ncbi:MAG: type II toxin-antitoxin system death-on-curing family toxin [Chloroflexia bacterium]|nr:type II toxin-antitoxin system death-on-curing family toxin [Chloroflexia bacterium]
MTVEYLSVADMMAIYYAVMEEMGERPAALVREAALESAVHRPRAAAYYAEASLAEQAVELGIGIALAHPWVDGNKRCAFRSMMAFLSLNGVEVPRPRAEAYLAVARQLEQIVAASGTNRDERTRLLIDELSGWATAATGE